MRKLLSFKTPEGLREAFTDSRCNKAHKSEIKMPLLIVTNATKHTVDLLFQSEPKKKRFL